MAASALHRCFLGLREESMRPANLSSSWKEMFITATQNADIAIVLCDMEVPGLPLTYVN